MTTIAYRNGLMAADSRMTTEDDSGCRIFKCEKLYRIETPRFGEAIVGLAGETYSGLIFLDWLKADNADGPENLLIGDADFTGLVLTKRGLYEYDKWCRGERVLDRFYAIGSGAKAALGAMHMGADARQAVAVAARVDPYTGGPIITLSLESKTVRARPAVVAKDPALSDPPRDTT